jgi:hypothetical protein
MIVQGSVDGVVFPHRSRRTHTSRTSRP